MKIKTNIQIQFFLVKNYKSVSFSIVWIFPIKLIGYLILELLADENEWIGGSRQSGEVNSDSLYEVFPFERRARQA